MSSNKPSELNKANKRMMKELEEFHKREQLIQQRERELAQSDDVNQ